MAKFKIPKPPPELAGTALKMWKRFIAEIGKDREIKASSLCLLCKAWAEMWEADQQIEIDGAVLKLPNGAMQANPNCRFRDKARATVLELLREFGLTPSALGKIKPPAAKDEDVESLDAN